MLQQKFFHDKLCLIHPVYFALPLIFCDVNLIEEEALFLNQTFSDQTYYASSSCLI